MSTLPDSNRVLAICGGGNAGHAIAVAASQNFDGDVVWLVGSEEKAALLRAGVFSPEGLMSTGVIVGRADRVRAISAHAADVIPQADIVLIAVPAFAHASILQRIAPHLKRKAIIGALPARGGFEFEAVNLLSGVRPDGERTIFGLQTLPWSTRVKQPGRVANFGALKAQVMMAATPSSDADAIAPFLSKLFGTNVIPTSNFLNMTLGNPGQVIHPGLMYGLFHKWSGERFDEDTVPYFYRDTTNEAGTFVEQLSADVCAVAAKIQSSCGGALDLSGVRPVLEWLRCTYPTQTQDMTSVASCFRTGPLQARKAPAKQIEPGVFAPDFQYRYLTEDMAFGLVITRGFAELARVGTPAIDVVLRWGQRKLNTRFLRNGKLDTSSIRMLPVPQNYGFESLDALVQWYAGTSDKPATRLTA